MLTIQDPQALTRLEREALFHAIGHVNDPDRREALYRGLLQPSRKEALHFIIYV